VLNMHEHQRNPAIQALNAYVLSKSSTDAAFHAVLQALLGPDGLQTQNHVGFVLSERLVNMPVQVVPPMYRMLSDEIKWANEEKEPYTFSHYLFLTRTYRLTEQQAMELESRAQRPSKRQKNKPQPQTALPPSTSGPASASYSFHPEDECIQKFASHTLDYALTKQQPREEDSFGLDIGGRLMLLPAERFHSMVDALTAAYAVK